MAAKKKHFCSRLFVRAFPYTSCEVQRCQFTSANYVILLAIGMPGIHPSSSRGLGSTIGHMEPILTFPHTPIDSLGPGNLAPIWSELSNHHRFALNNQWGRLPISDNALCIRHLHLPAGGHVFEFSQVYISYPKKEKTMDSKEQHAESSSLWGHPFLYKTLTRKIYSWPHENSNSRMTLKWKIEFRHSKFDAIVLVCASVAWLLVEIFLQVLVDSSWATGKIPWKNSMDECIRGWTKVPFRPEVIFRQDGTALHCDDLNKKSWRTGIMEDWNYII